MQNFPAYNFENFGGARSFSFIPVTDVASIPFSISSMLTSAVFLKSTKAWYTGLAVLRSLAFNEKLIESNAGKAYEYTISGIYPRQNSTMLSLFDDMARRRFILDIIDNNNERRLVGTVTNGARFTYSYNSGENTNQRPDYNFTFTFRHFKPAPFYNPQ